MKDTDIPLRLRHPNKVMRLSRLGCLHQTRLSFMRILTRRMAAEGWTFARPAWCIDSAGTGHAVYTATGPERSYSLIAFAHDLPADKRSDRVIAEAWDATFALFDGVPTDADIARLAANVPLQEAGRISERELTLARANRSVRLWDQVVAALSNGQQPDPADLAQVGYLMRTTAVYGSGKFGAADRDVIADRPEMAAPFQAEMLTVFLIRSFVRDLVNHTAQMHGGDTAVPLDDAIARGLGIGNSTGLGMAPFLINHPGLLHNWIAARETAIARVRALPAASEAEAAMFTVLLRRAYRDSRNWRSSHPRQAARVAQLTQDLRWLIRYIDRTQLLRGPTPWRRLVDLAETRDAETCELVHSLILEPYPNLVDDLAAGLACPADGTEPVNGAMTTGTLRMLLQQIHGWALSTDWEAPDICARAWYVSEEKLEPRLAERHTEPVVDYEQPLAPTRDAAALYHHIADIADDTPVAHILLTAPKHRSAVRRVQMCIDAPYAEIRDNTISADLMPIDMLRAKLSFFGATRFDPRSDRWVRINMFAGAPYPDQIGTADADRWVYPAHHD